MWERRARPGVPEGEATGVPFPGVKGRRAASASADSPALPGAACPGSTSAAASGGSAAWEEGAAWECNPYPIKNYEKAIF